MATFEELIKPHLAIHPAFKRVWCQQRFRTGSTVIAAEFWSAEHAQRLLCGFEVGTDLDDVFFTDGDEHCAARIAEILRDGANEALREGPPVA